VEKIEGGFPAMVTMTTGKTVAADDVVVCTNSPISDMVETHTKMAPYRTFVVAFAVPKGAIVDALYWDTPDPYHYVRLQPLDDTRDALIVGGEDHKTAHEDDAGERFSCLEEWTRARFTVAGERLAQWSGQVLETNDYLAFIGKNPDGAEHVWLATGDSGMGMTHGTIAGMLIADLILRRQNPWIELYDPGRVRTGAAVEWVKENLNVALQYTHWLTKGDVASIDQITPNNGAVIVESGRKIAVYRDERGTVHRRSAVCPHLGCIVAWNPAASTWDCPCHGSRFDKLGAVINGPSPRNLDEA
jgi:Rieske Fe-S protein